jgi:hypothetical protein
VSRLVTDLGDHFRDKGAKEERARVISWLEAVALAVAAPLEITGDDAEEAREEIEAEQRGALSIIGVLLSKLREIEE